MIQPFRDLTAEEFEILKAGIKSDGRSIAKSPVLLTEDGGIMYDGNQRCRALIALGRKRLNADEVRIVRGATRANMWEHAIRTNANRRHLSGRDKADAMHVMAGRGWSHTRIAKAFGMSRPGVSQLMAKYPAAEGVEQTDTTEGEDGKTYPRGVPRKKPQNMTHPWSPKGAATRMVENLIAKLAGHEIPEDLTPFERDGLAERLADLSGAIDQFLAYMHE